nr:hypothetical protein CFP56_50278 [Quercus suber]
MKIATWNVRGVGNARFCLNVQDLINGYGSDILVILEPRISGNHAEHVIGQVKLPRHFRVDPIGLSSGIWVLWDDRKCNVDVVRAIKQSVTMIIKVELAPLPYVTINTDGSSKGNPGMFGEGGVACSTIGKWLWVSPCIWESQTIPWQNFGVLGDSLTGARRHTLSMYGERFCFISESSQSIMVQLSGVLFWFQLLPLIELVCGLC